MPEVRKATSSALAPLSEALARAFDDDPIVNWAFSHPGRRAGGARRFFARMLRWALPQGAVYAHGDGAAALWALPGQWRMTHREEAGFLTLVPWIGLRSPIVGYGLGLVETRHPRDPHAYLAVLGVDPPLQGGGVGSALLAPMLHTCDRDLIPAYLETGKERNVDFYSRHGFRVTEELQLPRGPRVWLMWRDPAV